jgi:hypothetical protein
VQAVKPSLIEVGPVKDQQIIRLEAHVLDNPAITALAVGGEDAVEQHPAQDGVEFDGTLARPKIGPGKDTGAEL